MKKEKLFEVIVEKVSSERMYIFAVDKQNAQEIAEELIEAGEEVITDDASNFELKVSGTYKIDEPASFHLEIAECNREASVNLTK
jgi:NADH/NAD ratio-sensing transcriptional regulator Rex